MKYALFSRSIGSLILNISLIFSSTLFANSNNAMQINVIPSAPNIDAEAYILIDYYSGKVLAEKMLINVVTLLV